MVTKTKPNGSKKAQTAAAAASTKSLKSFFQVKIEPKKEEDNNTDNGSEVNSSPMELIESDEKNDSEEGVEVSTQSTLKKVVTNTKVNKSKEIQKEKKIDKIKVDQENGNCNDDDDMNEFATSNNTQINSTILTTGRKRSTKSMKEESDSEGAEENEGEIKSNKTASRLSRTKVSTSKQPLKKKKIDSSESDFEIEEAENDDEDDEEIEKLTEEDSEEEVVKKTPKKRSVPTKSSTPAKKQVKPSSSSSSTSISTSLISGISSYPTYSSFVSAKIPTNSNLPFPRLNERYISDVKNINHNFTRFAKHTSKWLEDPSFCLEEEKEKNFIPDLYEVNYLNQIRNLNSSSSSHSLPILHPTTELVNFPTVNSFKSLLKVMSLNEWFNKNNYDPIYQSISVANSSTNIHTKEKKPAKKKGAAASSENSNKNINENFIEEGLQAVTIQPYEGKLYLKKSSGDTINDSYIDLALNANCPVWSTNFCPSFYYLQDPIPFTSSDSSSTSPVIGTSKETKYVKDSIFKNLHLLVSSTRPCWPNLNPKDPEYKILPTTLFNYTGHGTDKLRNVCEYENHPNLLQIWSFYNNDGENFQEDISPIYAKLSFCIGFESSGSILEAKFSKIRVDPSQSMGIVAVVCSDGSVKILAIPSLKKTENTEYYQRNGHWDDKIPSFSSENEPDYLGIPVYSAEPLILTVLNPPSQYSYTTFSWSPHNDYEFLCGHSDGSFSHWSLIFPKKKNSNPDLKTSINSFKTEILESEKIKFKLPLSSYQPFLLNKYTDGEIGFQIASIHYVTHVSFHPKNPNLILTSSNDSVTKIWSKNLTHCPIYSNNKQGILGRGVTWDPNSMGFYYSMQEDSRVLWDSLNCTQLNCLNNPSDSKKNRNISLFEHQYLNTCIYNLKALALPDGNSMLFSVGHDGNVRGSIVSNLISLKYFYEGTIQLCSTIKVLDTKSNKKDNEETESEEEVHHPLIFFQGPTSDYLTSSINHFDEAIYKYTTEMKESKGSTPSIIEPSNYKAWHCIDMINSYIKCAIPSEQCLYFLNNKNFEANKHNNFQETISDFTKLSYLSPYSTLTAYGGALGVVKVQCFNIYHHIFGPKSFK